MQGGTSSPLPEPPSLSGTLGGPSVRPFGAGGDPGRIGITDSLARAEHIPTPRTFLSPSPPVGEDWGGGCRRCQPPRGRPRGRRRGSVVPHAAGWGWGPPRAAAPTDRSAT